MYGSLYSALLYLDYFSVSELPISLMLFVYLVERNTGYDTGVISGALVTIGSDLGPAELSNGQKVSIILPGGFYFTYHHHQRLL